MSSKKLLFIISLVILASSLMSFNANPESNIQHPKSNLTASLSYTSVEFGAWNLGFLSDTLPSDMQERVAELHRKREQIRKEVKRIKAEEEAKAAKKAQAEIAALEKEQEKANKDAIAQIKAEEKANQDAIKQKEKAAKKAEADRLKAIKKEERKVEAALKAKQKEEANRLKNEQDAERQALKDKVAKAQADVNTTVSDKDALKAAKKRDAEIAKAAKQKEREALKAIKAKEHEEKARQKAAAAADMALANPNVNNEDALKAAKKRDAEIAKAAKQKEREALKAIKAKEREEKARQKAAAADMALANPNVNNEDALKAAKKRDAEIAKAAKQKEREALKAVKAKEREEKAKQKAAAADMALANPNISEEDALKVARKRDAELAKAAKQKEREALRAARAKEREDRAALLAQQKAEAAAAAKAGLVYDEDPPGQQSTPNVSIPADPNENPRLQAKSVEVADKKGNEDSTPKVITDPILPPPPAKDATTETPRDKTKDAVAKALKRKNKKKKGGIKLPGINNKSDMSNEVLLEECDFEFNEFDPITQKVKRGLSHRFFFSYTEEILKEYMQGEDYLVCTGGLIDIQGIIALDVEFVIDSPQARYDYGSIGAGAQMILQLIDGEIITLLSEKSDSGRINKATGKTEFSTIFLISPREEKTLRKTEISAVRMVWGTGYEDYEVNELDFLINQFQCIDAARDN